MSVEVFVDTNILYYANTVSEDPRHVRARECVRGLWAGPGRAAVSVQVLQELHVNLVRKAGLAPAQSAARVSHTWPGRWWTTTGCCWGRPLTCSSAGA